MLRFKMIIEELKMLVNRKFFNLENSYELIKAHNQYEQDEDSFLFI